MNRREFEKRAKEAEMVIPPLINGGEIITKRPEHEMARFAEFYRKQANLSLIAADLLFIISTEKEAKEFHRLDPGYEGFLWVVNPSYYSMFYAVHALLAHRGVRILSKQGVHNKTGHALVYFCVKNNFIAKELYSRFMESQSEAAELLSLDDLREKAIQLASKYFYEAEKRSRLTYETDEEAKRKHAHTSLKRAKEFLNEIEQIIER